MAPASPTDDESGQAEDECIVPAAGSLGAWGMLHAAEANARSADERAELRLQRRRIALQMVVLMLLTVVVTILRLR